MINNLKEEINSLKNKVCESWDFLNVPKFESEIKELESVSLKDDFWNDQNNAQNVLKKIKILKDKIEGIDTLKHKVIEIEELYELCDDETFEKEIEKDFLSLQKSYEKEKIKLILSKENDQCGAFLEIHAGAGGTESCDWASMLYRMYVRWGTQNGYRVSTVDILESEGGIKSVTIEIDGLYAYGFLKSEIGIHRLVRISPFDANKKRHTSFASVSAFPNVEDDINIVINEKDLKIDASRSSGAGGQGVNTTDSAVRILHIPTGIVVQCQNERSLLKNKDFALKILKARLYEYYQKEKEEKKEKIDKKEIAWGSQIRSYVFQPYTIVKDHRTQVEKGDVDSVMNGELIDFMEGFLKWSY